MQQDEGVGLENESSTSSFDLASVSRMNPKWRVVGRGGEGEGERNVGRRTAGNLSYVISRSARFGFGGPIVTGHG